MSWLGYYVCVYVCVLGVNMAGKKEKLLLLHRCVYEKSVMHWECHGPGNSTHTAIKTSEESWVIAPLVTMASFYPLSPSTLSPL